LTEPVDPDGGDPEEPSINVILSNISSLVYDAEGSPVASIVVNLVLNNSTGNSYKLQLRYRESGQTNYELTDPTAKTNITIPDLSTGVEYEIQARAVRGEKYSPWTPTQTHTVYNTSEVASAIPTIISLSQLDQPLKPINTVQSYIVAEYSIEGVQPPPEVVEIKWNVQGSADIDTRTFEVEPETNSYSVRLPIDTYGVTYEVKARAKGINGVWSQYSPASTITTTDPVISVSEALDFLQGEITESQLFQSLNDRIDLIDADAAVEGSVNQRIEQTASTLEGDIVAVEQNTTTNASEIDGLSAQYTVKIDNNGSVSGFGLASTPNDDTTDGSFSEFYVNADRFAITEPGSTSPNIPFIVQTSSTTNNGEFVSSGVYIEDAFIKNGDVETLKIGDNAVTVPVSEFRTTNYSGDGVSQEIAEVFITNSHSSPIFTSFFWNARVSYSSGSRDTTYFAELDGNTIVDYGTLAAINDFPSAGGQFTIPANETVRLRLFWIGEDSSVSISDISLVAEAVKK
jgi:hypothetical protein